MSISSPSPPGTRVGALRWLTWDDVDPNLGVLHVRPKPDGTWKPKSGDIRAIPISPAAPGWYSKACPSTDVGSSRQGLHAAYPRGDRQISERRILAHLKRIPKRLGLPGYLHTFRHAFISHASPFAPEPIDAWHDGWFDEDIDHDESQPRGSTP